MTRGSDRGRDRRRDVRADPAVRGPGLRPPLVRLLGGRRLAARRPPAWPGWRRAHRTRRGVRTVPAAAGQPVPRRPRRNARRTRSRRPGPAVGAANPFLVDDEPLANPFAPRPVARPGSTSRRAAQAPTAGPRARRRRQLRQGPAARRRAGGLLPVRAADGVPARAAHPRPLPGAARFAAAGRHHLHRDDRGAPGTRDWPTGSSMPSAPTSRERGFAAVETYPEVGRPGGRDERGDAGVLGVARVRSSGRRRPIPGPAPRAGVTIRAPRAGSGRAPGRSASGSACVMAGCAAPTTSPVPPASAAAVASDRHRQRRPAVSVLAVARRPARRRRRRRSSSIPRSSATCRAPSTRVVLEPDPATAAEVGTDPGARRLRRRHRGHDGLRPDLERCRDRLRRRDRRPSPPGRLQRRLVP